MYVDVFNLVLDSKDYTVGGGAASALAGAMAAGMVGMVARLSMAKPEGMSVKEYEAIADEADALVPELLKGSEADQEAYLGIKAAYKLPKESQEEKALRSKAISDAGYHAARVPGDNGKMNRRVWELAGRLLGRSNPNCLSDLKCAIYLSEMGVKGCILNVEANLGLIKDQAQLAELEFVIFKLGVGICG